MRGILYCLLPLSLSIPAMAQTSITQSFQSNPTQLQNLIETLEELKSDKIIHGEITPGVM